MEEKKYPGMLDTPFIKVLLKESEEIAGEDRVLKFVQRQQAKLIYERPMAQNGESFDAQIFDNMYFIGCEDVCCFVFKTEEGILMIDSGLPDAYEERILPAFRKYGLDPKDVKYLMVTHTGPDHVGSAYPFWKNYGTKVIMTAPDWRRKPDTEENLRRMAPDYPIMGKNIMDFPWPEEGIVGEDGMSITLGNTMIWMYYTPRRVGEGGLSFIATVWDKGKPHMFCTYGNTNVVGRPEDMKLYQVSVDHFLDQVKEKKCDVMLSDHPFVDDSFHMIKEWDEGGRKGNPFIQGHDWVCRFFRLLNACAKVIAARRDEGLNWFADGPHIEGSDRIKV